jgi:hypothetical protein
MLPEEVGAVFDAHIPAFVAQIIPVYHRYFSAEEIKGMIAFYSTDLGRKAISAMPGLMSESMMIGQKMGRRAVAGARRARARAAEEGRHRAVSLYMVIEHFRGGDPVPVYRRFRERGRMAPRPDLRLQLGD